MRSLWWWNFVCGTLHLVQGGALFIISFTNSDAKAFLMPITSLFCNWDNNGIPEQVLGVVVEIVYIRWCSYFSLMSAVAHYNVLYFFDTYEAGLKKGVNRFRWWEYAFSGSLIMTLLFLVWGNLDWV